MWFRCREDASPPESGERPALEPVERIKIGATGANATVVKWFRMPNEDKNIHLSSGANERRTERIGFSIDRSPKGMADYFTTIR
jgi:hypothetical protein